MDFPAPEGPTIARVAPGRDLEAHVFEDRAAGVVAERHAVELDPPAVHDQVPGVGRVGDLLGLREEVEHLLDVDEPLLDLPVDEAEEAQGLVDLHQVGVRHDEPADGHRPGDDPVRAEQHDRGEPARDDRGLADVE